MEPLPLPPPRTRGSVSVEEALERRRSVRDFRAEPLTRVELSQVLFAAQGVTHAREARTTPSAGALYPLELYVVTAEGLLRYEPTRHRAARVAEGDLRGALAAASLGQEAVERAAAVFVIAAVEARSAAKYNRRAERYVKLEAGHAAQSILLQAVALGLAGVPVGAFEDDRVRAVLGLPRGEEPLYLVCVGRPAEPR